MYGTTHHAFQNNLESLQEYAHTATQPRYVFPGFTKPDRTTAIRLQCRDFHFLDLPGEIRNKIYEILFAEEHSVQVRGNHPQRELQQALLRGYRAFKPQCRLWAQFGCPSGERAGRYSWLPLDLLLVCRSVYEETQPLLYSRINLRVSSIGTLNRFLDLSSGVTYIKKLELVHSTYGEPVLLDMREWKLRHDRQWMKLCTRVAQEMTGLKSVRITLHINDWPTQLELHAAWAEPLLVLKGDGLDRVEIKLRHSAFSEQRLTAASRKLEMEMMNDKGREMKRIEAAMEAQRVLEAARLKKLEGPKARKSLRITLQGATATGKA